MASRYSGLLFHLRLCALHDLLRLNLLDVRGDPPRVAKLLGHTRFAISIKRVRRRHERSGARCKCALINGVCVVHAQIKSGRHWFALAARSGDHHHRITDSHFGMFAGSICVRYALDFRRRKNVLPEIDEPIRAPHGHIGRNRMVALGNWFASHKTFFSFKVITELAGG